MQFTRLRLHGFKSFVDPTELLIEPGLTGIVGPNGCGKSNLVEALQWVMGESSARRLRGGEMDEIIFGGTASRPGRGHASVTLSLDNSDRTAASEIANADELEIDRRIDRGKGSTYRVNGKEARARDVQLLFADAASGAQSVSMIGQGRIGWLINAKPAERRMLLEEAAGIGGLQARRHEAELKLAAAEANLVRLSDVETTLVQQTDRLKKQARQAERYRRLSEQLRLAEALLAYRHFLDRSQLLTQAEERLRAAAALVSEAAAKAAEADRARITAHAVLPALREQAAAASREVERAAGALLNLDAEATRVAAAMEELRRRLAQLDQDAGRENELARDAESALERLQAEAAGLTVDQARETAARGGAEAALADAVAALAQAESFLAAATSAAAASAGARLAVEKRLAAIEERQRRLARQTAESEAKARELDLLSVPPARLEAAETEAHDAEAMAARARAALEAAEQRLREADQEFQATRSPVHAAEHEAVKLRAEIEALLAILRHEPGKGFPPLLDGIHVSDGLEAALGAALGDDLLAATDPSAPIFWAELPDAAAPPLPDGAAPMAAAVEGPALLKRRLAAIGLVPDAATGSRLQPLLAPGQRLVSRDGALWRWDGLTMAAGAKTAAAVRLAQRTRLRALKAECRVAEAALAELVAAEGAAQAVFQAAQRDTQAARTAQAQSGQTALRARQAQQALGQQHAQAEARRQAAAALAERLAAETEEVAVQAAEIERERAALPDDAAGRREVDWLRGELGRAREAEAAARRQLDALAREQGIRARRLDAIATEESAWRNRFAAAATQRLVLAERRQALDAERALLAARPAALAAERTEVETALAARRREREAADAALTAAEAAANAADAGHEALAAIHAERREDRVRAEAIQEQALAAKQEAAAAIGERFGCTPAVLPDSVGLGADALDEPTDAVAARIERLRRDREAIGPVNLMAESELAELTAELDTIRAESADLVEAIARLRHAVRELDREGRQRLLKAFDAVNEHFQTLFQRLFGGGKAHLQLSGGDGDPLAAGLEIMASPPGKKLQSLSLLSGGERALTALALVFAVFLTNPAPVCVLDEVDAPLDDANVERFCSLVSEIAGQSLTRFLIVTHHRVTMARMDRLYGVTMVERGVSRIVSVALGGAEELRRTA
ncbi:MAG TPA: AAA family ATPase [Stellaceae bacterium]|nr:AAA family ATPase [Stellaceae bacterium]